MVRRVTRVETIDIAAPACGDESSLSGAGHRALRAGVQFHIRNAHL
jgi:hypothetical protein